MESLLKLRRLLLKISGFRLRESFIGLFIGREMALLSAINISKELMPTKM